MVSIIVPVYNGEKYLQDAIDSVFMQTYTDWELILVDDGSTDNSGQICDQAARKSSRVKVVHTPNRGVSAARNIALHHSRGEYITFLDADDVLPIAALFLLTECATHFKADIVCGHIKEFAFEDPLLLPEISYNLSAEYAHIKTFTAQKGVMSILYQKQLDNSSWGKLYATRLWKEQRFSENIRYEDLDLIPRLFLDAEKIIKIRKTVYFYRQHPESYVHTFSLGRADVLDVTARLSDFFSLQNPTLAKAARARELNANFNIFGLITSNQDHLTDEGIDEEKTKALLLKEQCWIKIKELRGEALRNPSVRLKTKIGILVSYLGGRRLLEKLSRKIYR